MVDQDSPEEGTEGTCRLCDENCFSMHSVFEKVPEGQQVLQLIRDCLSIPIYRTDPLPKQICDSCFNNLLNLSSFKKVTYENLERQKERLQRGPSRNDAAVQLYLNALEQDIDDLLDNRCTSSQNEDHSTKGSLHNGHIYNDDEDSRASSCRVNVASSSCSQAAPGDFDLQQLDESDSEYIHPKIVTSNIGAKRKRVIVDTNSSAVDRSPAPKKRRFVGPKSRIQERKDKYLRILNERANTMTVKYEPFTLLRCSLNVINKMNLDDYKCDNFETVLKIDDVSDDNICDHCDAVFTNVVELAKHESSHIFVSLGEKIDAEGLWEEGVDEDAAVRNKWLEECRNEDLMVERFSLRPLLDKNVTNFDDSTGRVNVIDPEDVEFKDPDEEADERPSRAVREGYAIKGEVVLIDTQATVNGVLLADLPKDGRRAIYKSVTVNGVKRKFCQLCRYTFKDNWAIECHYFSTACHYTCRFCGVRFNKQRNDFDAHIKQHILVGDEHTTRIFASRKFHSLPKVIHESKMKDRPWHPTSRQVSVPPKIKPIKMIKRSNDDLEHGTIPSFEIKKEVESDEEGRTNESNSGGNLTMQSGSGKQNQAYFCRKCFQVFFKLDEFNVHVVSCAGTGLNNAKTARHQTRQQTSNNKQMETATKLSPTGRPIRNCVREIGTYSDEMQDDYEYTPYFKREHVKPTARGFECNFCDAAFPTFHSRNSHMRIHKNVHELSNKSVTITRNNRSQAATAKRAVDVIRGKYSTTAGGGEVRIKQEPIEPIVEIHEHQSTQQSNNNFPSSIGSVSITPIPSAYRKETKLDPSIIKLVQNNPNITIRKSDQTKQEPFHPGQQYHHLGSGPSSNNGGGVGFDFIPGMEQDGKCYRCLSCSKAFANKSNLYFHKKNQCHGSKYPCPFCKKRFGTEAAYSSHIFYNHPE